MQATISYREKPRKIAITVCATKMYCYAMAELAMRVQGNYCYLNYAPEIIVILVGDGSEEFQKAAESFRIAMDGLGTIKVVEIDAASGLKNYEKDAQRLIARMRSIAFGTARNFNVDACWSLDSDVLPPPNALSCLIDMLQFDNQYFSVATAPYPSQGGGDWLGGRGTPINPISEDWLDSERMDSTKSKIEKRIAVLARLNTKLDDAHKANDPLLFKKLVERSKRAKQNVRKFPPKGDVFELNSKGKFRKRGWFSQAYPAIGLGATVPSDWCGFGCTLMNREALAYANFDGYDGAGTEDLFIVWQRWFPRRLKIVAVPHCPCDHVIRASKIEKGKSVQIFNEFFLIESYHETEGECVGHLRKRRIPWQPLGV